MGTFKDLTGEIFGKLTVKNRIGSKNGRPLYLCHCECGKDVSVVSIQLTRTKHPQTNCGCMRFGGENRVGKKKNKHTMFIGQKMHMLTYLSKIEGTGNFGLFKCDCGVEKAIRISYLFTKNPTQSCGCYHKNKIRKEAGSADAHVLYDRYIRNAVKRKIDFLLTKEEFLSFTKMDCYFCGQKPAAICKNSSSWSQYVYNGVDRINSKLPYTLDNCVTCCCQCNWMKLDYSEKEFLDHVKKIYEFTLSKENLASL